MWVQCVKTSKWKDKGIIESVRTADDGTIKSYALLIDGVLTTIHRRFLAKVVKPHSGEENSERAPSQTSSQELSWESRPVSRMSSKASGDLCLYGFIMTAYTAVLAYLLTTSCGIDSEIEGSNNEVDNKIQKGLFCIR